MSRSRVYLVTAEPENQMPSFDLSLLWQAVQDQTTASRKRAERNLVDCGVILPSSEQRFATWCDFD